VSDVFAEARGRGEMWFAGWKSRVERFLFSMPSTSFRSIFLLVFLTWVVVQRGFDETCSYREKKHRRTDVLYSFSPKALMHKREIP